MERCVCVRAQGGCWDVFLYTVGRRGLKVPKLLAPNYRKTGPWMSWLTAVHFNEGLCGKGA